MTHKEVLTMNLQRLRNSNKGASVAGVWAKIICWIFGIAVMYIPLDYTVRVTIYDIGISMGADATLMGFVRTIWTVLPFLWTGAFILYGINYTLRKGGEGNVRSF